MNDHSHQLETLSKGKYAYFVELGNKKSYPLKGIGSSSIRLKYGSNIHLNNIMFVPGLQKNLLSISSLEYKGDRVAFIDGKLVLWAKGSSIEQTKVIGIREGRFYKLIDPVNHALVHTEINPCELWHRRFGHLHFKILLTLNSIVDGIPNIKEDHEGIYKGSELGNNTKKPFGSSSSWSKEILDVIHSDVCGPMTIKSLGGNIYYVTFIDDHLRKMGFT